MGARPSLLLFESANPRHAHEVKLFTLFTFILNSKSTLFKSKKAQKFETFLLKSLHQGWCLQGFEGQYPTRKGTKGSKSTWDIIVWPGSSAWRHRFDHQLHRASRPCGKVDMCNLNSWLNLQIAFRIIINFSTYWTNISNLLLWIPLFGDYPIYRNTLQSQVKWKGR